MIPNSTHLSPVTALPPFELLLFAMMRSLLQVRQGYSDLVKGLLEKLTHDHSTSLGITASALTLQSPQADSHSGRTTGRTLARASHLMSHADLRFAVALLLLAAEALPEQDVEFTVCRLLFDQASQLCS